MILALKTAGAETQIVLFQTDGTETARLNWQSGRQLAEGLLVQISQVLEANGQQLADLSGLVVFRGPGSFTSLRIGIATVNALAYALAIPNVGTKEQDWLRDGLSRLAEQSCPQIITPLYDRGPHTTQPKR